MAKIDPYSMAGSVLGSTVGTVFGGPMGGMAGSTAGSNIGRKVGTFVEGDDKDRIDLLIKAMFGYGLGNRVMGNKPSIENQLLWWFK